MRVIRLLVLAAAAMLAACATPRGPDEAALMRALEAEIAVAVDAVRAGQIGAAPLARDHGLDEAARTHSADMGARGYFDHVDPQGLTALDRVRAANPGFAGLLAENIAVQARLPGTEVTPQAVAAGLVQAWLDSPSHRRTLLSQGYMLTGIGAALAEDAVYVTQLFARPIPGAFDRSRFKEAP